MTDNLTLTFPKKNCEEITFKGQPFIHIDTGMTAEEFIEMLMRYAVSDDKVAVVIKKDGAE